MSFDPKNRPQITISLDAKVHEVATAQAKKLGYSVTGYVTLLFEAAYAARFGKSGDKELDQVVAGTLMLHGSGIDYAAIAKALGVTEETVEKVVGAWFDVRGEVAA